MISLRIQKKTVHSPLLVLITQPDRQQEDKYDSNLFLHIQFYSFLLIDTPHGNIFSKHDFPPPWVILPQERNGARYLDPKFSIWMSTVPVLDDYLTSATTSDDARKRNQNLLDMGALFNTTCCHLYNYCSNNPVRYIDPDGRDCSDEDFSYMISRLENPIRIPKVDDYGNFYYSEDEWGGYEYIEIDTVIIAPFTTIKGKYDGSVKINGDYIKVSSQFFKLNYTVDLEGMKFDDSKSHNLNNFFDWIKNTRKKNELTSGYYKNGTTEALYLSGRWDETIRNDLGIDANVEITNELLEEKYNSPQQQLLRAILDYKHYKYPQK